MRIKRFDIRETAFYCKNANCEFNEIKNYLEKINGKWYYAHIDMHDMSDGKSNWQYMKPLN